MNNKDQTGDGNTQLPVWELREQLRAAWSSHNRLILVAPTGSGKTTQICQMILSDHRNHDKQIVVLQPRRVAARAIARRVASEMGVELGGVVGYQVRFDDSISPTTRIAFVTEGILLRWMQDDPALSHIGDILFDEFHERNLLSDIGLALVKNLQARERPDLLLMVMSATLDSAPISEYLGGCPLLESTGRAYPVEIHYADWQDERPVWELAAEKTADILRDTTSGDILIFMPGTYEIVRTIEELRHSKIKSDVVIIPLHGELSPQDQDRAFAPSSYRRIIVSTNVAETSVTLPGIRYVIDSGLARIARYDVKHGMSQLPIEPISRASAEQRTGRAGRLGPGECYRLWTRANHEARPERNTAEIQRMELAEVVLLRHSFGVVDAEHFDFLDKPDAVNVHRAEVLLESLGAISAEPHRITAIGREMQRLPVHPRYARMLIEAVKLGCVREVALFVSLVSGRDLLVRLNRDDKITRRNRESLTRQDQSDFYLLAAALAHAAQQNFDYKSCYSYGVNPHVAREVALTYRQMLKLIGADADAEDIPTLAQNPAIQRCHLVGFIDQMAVRMGGS
ncbi:MAG TPA: helicase-related protein, partial [Anaerolineae bacterium]